MKTFISIVSIFVVGLSTSVFADCVKDGKSYATGTRFGEYTCMPDGSWRR